MAIKVYKSIIGIYPAPLFTTGDFIEDEIVAPNNNYRETKLVKSGAGFTLIELMVVMGILAIIGSIGLVVSFDFYRSYSFNSERDILVSILQKARSQSLANINQAPHGVCVTATKYIIYQGTPADCIVAANDPASQSIDASPGIQHSGLQQVTFDQLSGNASFTPGNQLTLSYANRSSIIKLNNLGQIDW